MAAIVIGVPARFTPASDSIATRVLAEQVWHGATAGSREAAYVLNKYDTVFKRSLVFGLTSYSCTIDGKPEKLVGCAFPRTDEGHAVANALCSAAFLSEASEPRFFSVGGGGLDAAVVPFPPGGKSSKAHIGFLKDCNGRTKSELQDTFVHRVPSINPAIFSVPRLLQSIVASVPDLKFAFATCRFGKGFPGLDCVFDRTPEVVTSSVAEISELVQSAADGAARPIPSQIENMAHDQTEMRAHAAAPTRPNKAPSAPTAPASAAAATATAGSSATADPFIISADQRLQMARSIKGIRKGNQSSKRPWSATLVGPGGRRSVGVELYKDIEHRQRGCSHSLFQNFRSQLEARRWLYDQLQLSGKLEPHICPDGVFDEAAQLRLWGSTPLTETNLTQPFAYIPAETVARGGGLMYYEDDPPELLLARQRCTPGHPNYLPPDARPPFPPPEPAPADAAATADAPPAAAPADASADEDEPQSQPSVLPPTNITPSRSKRPRSESPAADDDATIMSSISSATATAFQPNSDTNFIVFATAPFVTETEVRAILLGNHIANPSHLGLVKHATRKGEPDAHYIVACLHDVPAGDRLVAELAAVTHCHVPLAPRWVPAHEWCYFFTLRSKTSAHGRLGHLANSELIRRLKEECPASHHARFDALLCRTDDTFAISEEYKSWFAACPRPSSLGTAAPSSF